MKLDILIALAVNMFGLLACSADSSSPTSVSVRNVQAQPTWIMVRADSLRQSPPTIDLRKTEMRSPFDGVYGVQGVPAAENHPAARGGAVSWIGADGRLWLFGGDGCNDLWQFDPESKKWTWFGGSSPASHQGIFPSSVYGTQGVPSAKNWPGSRDGAIGWTDTAGKLWMFGGEFPGKATYLNDLWQFDPVSKQWTWVNGSVSNVDTLVGVFGTKGVATPQNQPGGRQYATSWRDASGKLWLFGGFNGYGTQEGTNGVTNDLWQFDPSTRQWTWMGGATTPNGIGKYGRQGHAEAENQPGARLGAISWTDAAGKFWLFGGQGLDANGLPYGYGYMNDLWQFDPVSGQWAWMAGPTTTSTPQYGGKLTEPVAGVYGTQGDSSSKNLPGARLRAASWSDASGRLWMFGGLGYDNQGREHALNDLWRFNPSTRQWTWVDGAAGIAVCQRLNCQTTENSHIGEATGSTLPVPRFGGVAWTTATGQNWLFGGLYLNEDDNPETLNDVWSFQP